MDDHEEDWDYETTCRLTKTVALWTSQLLRITPDKIGSVYMRWIGEARGFLSMLADLSNASCLVKRHL